MTIKPKPTKGDVAHKAAKIVLSGIPFAGGPVAELFNAVIIPPLEKRRNEWLESLYEGLKELEEKVEGFKIVNLKDNEMFITTVMHATQVAVRNHQKEKLEALRAAVLNSITPNAPEEDLQLMFLNWVDELIPWHLRILKFFDSPETWVNKSDITIPDWEEASPERVFFHVFPKLKDQRTFFDLLIQELADLKELLLEDKLRSPMKKMAYLRISHTTNLGKQFIQFITSPIEEENGS